MSTSESPADKRLDELRETGQAIGKIAEDASTFTRVAEAFRAKNAEAFQSELGKLKLIPYCEIICR